MLTTKCVKTRSCTIGWLHREAMNAELPSYKWTFLAGLALLAAVFWVIPSDETMSDVAFLFFTAGMVGLP
jgi:hypothetical protein